MEIVIRSELCIYLDIRKSKTNHNKLPPLYHDTALSAIFPQMPESTISMDAR
jgi:hypothetical protein